MKKLILIATFAVAVAAYGQKSNLADTVTVASASKTNKVIRSIPSPAEQVNVEQMKKSMQTSSLDALSGQVAGVQVQTTSNHEVMVNAVRVRGTTSLTGGNDPLVIIDGVASDLATLSTIYPPDIESITVLKNASETSQYGSRGAAGVIEVTTKKGKSGRFHISYDGIFGIEAKHKWLNMLNANEFRQAAQQMNVSIIDRGYDTDFIEAITRTGFSHNHHVSFGGGSENSNYRCSLGMRNHKTIIRNNDLRTYIAKLDITQRAFDERVTFDIGVFGNIQYADLLPARQKLLYSAAAFNPTFPEGKNEKGQYENITESNWISNPNNVVNMEDDDETSALNAHIRAKANLGYHAHTRRRLV
jgi:TonB-dependent SusC/RagA subfamily outer membrane receptor